MPELSIIVPVYNVEKYLPKCIDSILAQTFTDFELILIDDGSPDRCGEICDEYAAKDSRIVVIHQKNQGVSAARNAGLDIAQSLYLGFVDSDDWISPNMYQKMLLEAQQTGADIVTCAMQVRSPDGDCLRLLFPQEREYNSEQMLKELFASPNQLAGSCCNKIFLRSVVSDVRFPESVAMCEDRIYLFGCYARSKKCVKIGDPLYQIVEAPNSATRKKSIKNYLGIIDSSKRLISLTGEMPKRIKGYAVDKYIDDCLLHLKNIKQTAKESGEAWKTSCFKIKMSVLRWITHSFISHLLPNNKLRGYLYSLKHI